MTLNQQAFPYRVHEDTVAGTYNGSNVTFTLKLSPQTQSLTIHNASGLYLREGVDYTRSNKTLTAAVAPETPDNWVADYYSQG